MTVVYTETSKYLLDRANKMITRLPGEGQGMVAGLSPTSLSTLRKDATPLKVHSVLTCEIGKPMELLIQVRDDEIPTYRKTTVVRSIIEDN